MNSYLTSSYTAIVIIGNNTKFINDIRNYVKNTKKIKLGKYKNIHLMNTGIIDFIIPDEKAYQSNEMDDFYEIVYNIRDIITSRKYLQVHTIWCINYMSNVIDIRICAYECRLKEYTNNKTIVALKPGEITWDLYSSVCLEYNLSSQIFHKNNLTNDDVRIVIKSVFVDDFEYLFDLFESM